MTARESCVMLEQIPVESSAASPQRRWEKVGRAEWRRSWAEQAFLWGGGGAVYQSHIQSKTLQADKHFKCEGRNKQEHPKKKKVDSLQKTNFVLLQSEDRFMFTKQPCSAKSPWWISRGQGGRAREREKTNRWWCHRLRDRNLRNLGYITKVRSSRRLAAAAGLLTEIPHIFLPCQHLCQPNLLVERWGGWRRAGPAEGSLPPGSDNAEENQKFILLAETEEISTKSLHAHTHTHTLSGAGCEWRCWGGGAKQRLFSRTSLHDELGHWFWTSATLISWKLH